MASLINKTSKYVLCAVAIIALSGVNGIHASEANGAVPANSYTFDLPELLSNKTIADKHYLPDFSYAGYANGERQVDTRAHQIIDVADHGIIANDGLDDSNALIKLLDSLEDSTTPTVLQFASGRYIISSIIYFDRNHLVVRGQGSGVNGTEFYFPRPLIYVPKAPELKELNEYLVELNKIQREKANNIHLPFTEWAWSGGFFWTRVEGERVKKYLDKYDRPIASLGVPTQGKQGELSFEVKDASKLSVGQVIELQWYNGSGKQDPILTELYADIIDYIGSHHWNFDNLALARQQSKIVKVEGNTVFLNTPLLHNINTDLKVNLAPWEHLEEIGFEHFSMNFAFAKRVAHHVEQGFNGIYLTRLYNGWVNDVHINNADSGILTEEVANITINNIVTTGEKYAHYSVQMGAVHNVLASNIHVRNKVEHPLSFNTFASKSVYVNAQIDIEPVLDQHSGINQQNLFDNIKVKVDLEGKREYPLFAGGGAKYWKPSHAAYNSFWNIQVQFDNGHQLNTPILLNGMKDGPLARVIGVSGNLPVAVEYAPSPYIEGVNLFYRSAPSLYYHQLEQRLKTYKP